MDETFTCPICQLTYGHAYALTVHVNEAHFKSPAKYGDSSIINEKSDKNGKAEYCEASTSKDNSCTSKDALTQQKASVENPNVELGDICECPVCGDLFGVGVEGEQAFQVHVESHFSTTDDYVSQMEKIRQEQALKFDQHQILQSISERKQNDDSKKFTAEKVERIQIGEEEGTTCTKDIIENLMQYYSDLNCTNVEHYWLASPLDHYCSSYGDKGWGCGYRNFQMLLSSLIRIPIYQEALFGGILKMPSIFKIQQLIENAWSKGYDPQGYEQLDKVLNTSKWIGATEICAVLSSLKVKYELVDFHRPTGKDNTHPQLFQWVKDYFTSDKPHHPPLYFQHQGHSRSIIGVEEYKDGTLKLLVFDPSTAKSQMIKFTQGKIDNNLMKTLRRTLQGLKAQQYQVVAAVGILNDTEQQRCKLLTSRRIP